MTLATIRRRIPPSSAALATLGLAVCLLAAGCGEEEDVSPSFEDRVPVGVSLESDEREVRFGASTVVQGRVTQGDERLASEEVRLQADPYPFDESWTDPVTSTTDDAGRFSLEVEPQVNTKYKVLAGDGGEAQSPIRAVYVNPLASVDSEPAEGGGTRFTSTFRHSPDRSLEGAAVYSYGGPVIRAEIVGSVPFVAIERVKTVKPGLSTATIELPGTASELAYEVCVSYAPQNAVGTPRARCSESRRDFEG